jgi:hypothetical protein
VNGFPSNPLPFNVLPLPALAATRLVPIVLSSAGLNGSSYSSELTLSNRGSTDAVVELAYVPAFGGGDVSSGFDSLPAGTQKVVPDALQYLAGLGASVPTSGDRGGTVTVRFYGLSSPDAGAATVRTTTAVPEGRAGLSYPAVPPRLLTDAVYLFGLRQNASDRSNVALVNAGGAADGAVVLRMTVFSGDGATSMVLPDVALSPGGFAQTTGILQSNGLALTSGYVKVERVSGTAPYYAYAVINDQVTSDGSFVPPFLVGSLVGKLGLTIPVVVETTTFSSELSITNWSAETKTVHLAYVADAVTTPDGTARFSLTLGPGQQQILPGFVDLLRQRGVAGIGQRGPTYAGALFATVDSGDAEGLLLGVRTTAPARDGGGEFGLFYTAVPYGSSARTTAWLYGLQQNDLTRSNLALVNTGEIDESGDDFRVEIYDGDTGRLAKVLETSLPPRRFVQMSSVLANDVPGVTNAYARVVRTAGDNPFIAYVVLNDGGVPGVRTDDGAFVTMDLSQDSQPPEPSLSLSAMSLSFGTVAVGYMGTQTLKITNAGNASLVGSASTAPPFSIFMGSPFSIAPGASQSLVVGFSPTSVGAVSGSLNLSTNDPVNGTSTVSLSGTGGSIATATEELSVDDGTLETGVTGAGDIVLNRLTPSRYPATVVTLRLYLTQYSGLPSPQGVPVRFLVSSDPSASGHPTPQMTTLLDRTITLPAVPSGGGFIDLAVPGLAPIASGDLYVGFQAPNPEGGVAFPADSSGLEENRSFFSTDGGATYQGLGIVNGQNQVQPVNFMMRAVVTEPALSISPRLFARLRLPPFRGNTPSASRDGLRGVGCLEQVPNAVFQQVDSPLQGAEVSNPYYRDGQAQLE